MSSQPPPLPKKRPALVWVIFVFYIYGAVSTLFSYGIIFFLQSVPLTAVQKEYFASLTIADYLMTALVTAVNLAAAIQLFRLKKQAPLLFLAAFLLAIAMVGYQSVAKNWMAAMGVAGLVGAGVGWAISITVIVYAWVLRTKRVLT